MNRLTIIVLFVANYYLTTLVLWFGHWFSHLRYSPTYEFHIGGHHSLYPSSRRSISARFLYGSGRHDSLFALLPPLLLQAAGLAWFTTSWTRGTVLLETALIASGVSWLHAQFHTGRSALNNYGWFRRARAIHFAHHDRDVNFMVGDHSWDRILGTFQR